MQTKTAAPARQETPVLVLFDADNTLFDGRVVYEKVLRKTFAQHFPRRDFSGIKLDNGQYSGKNIPQILREIAWEHHITDNSFNGKRDSLIKYGIEQFSRELENGGNVRVLPGVPELLEQLKRRNAVIGVVTGNPDVTAKLALKNAGLERHFSFILGGQEGNHKVENAVIALKRVLKDRLPARVVIVGDSPTEANVAKKTGFDFIGTATGLHTVEQLREHGGNTPVFRDLSNTKEVLKAIYEKERPNIRIAPNAVVHTRQIK